MKNILKHLALTVFTLLIIAPQLSAQKVAFLVSDVIREHFTEAKQVEQRIKSIVEDWKRELDITDKKIEDMRLDISKNRLVWTDEEKVNKEKELSDLITQRTEFARRKFEPGGEYDNSVKLMMKPIEDKIFAAVQQVAGDEGYDIIMDKSSQNIPYANSKYDLTVKVLRKLGVDVDKLEKELQEKIDKDPRNKKPDTKLAPGKRTKARGKSDDNKEIQQDENVPPNSPNSKIPKAPINPLESKPQNNFPNQENPFNPPDTTNRIK